MTSIVEEKDVSSPLVSVIIPCYNAGCFLRETVESVFSQTLEDYEIILIDDGSTDDTVSVIRSFGDRVISEIGPNRGASAARNRGTALSRGKFIQYIDADDLLSANALELRVRALQENNADVAYSDWQKLIETSESEFCLGEIVSKEIEDVHEDTQVACLTSFWAPPAALMYSRDVVDKIGGWRLDLPIIQDARFLLDAARNYALFIRVPEVSAYYRVLIKDSSLSRCSPAGFLEDVYTNACQIDDIWQKNSSMTAARRKALAQVYDYTARNLFAVDFRLFQENVKRLYRVEPLFRLSWSKIASLASSLLGQKNTVRLMSLLNRPPVSLS